MPYETNLASRSSPESALDRADRLRPEAELVPCLLMLAKQTRALLGLKLAVLDLVAGQDQMILVLSPNETMAACTLAQTLSVRPSTVSKMMDRMAEKDLITRLPDPDDARKVRVGLTPEGVRMQDRIRVLMAEFEEELLCALGDGKDETVTAVASLDHTLHSRLRRLR